MNYYASASMENVIKNLKLADESINQAKYNLDTAILTMTCSKWSSKTKDNFSNLMLLSEEFHNLLLEISEKNLKLIEEFFRDAMEYIDSSNILKDLEKY